MMAAEEDLSQPEMGENVMLQEAVEALRLGKLARARDLLTRLIKTDQNNAGYWVWLSAAMETQKERVYCLQTALQLDPANAAAKRGLVLLGALVPEGPIKPFPLNHPRAWEEQLFIEPPTPKKTSSLGKPTLRMLLTIGIGVVAVGLLYGLFMLPRSPLAGLRQTATRRFTRTPSPTVTFTPEYRTVTPTFAAPTPLWMLLPATYTPTAVYVSTEHPVTSRDAFNAAMRYFAQGDYASTIVLMEQIITMEPQAVDAYYYIGESQRMLGNYRLALTAFQETININPVFGPGFLGRALAKQGLNIDDGVLDDLSRAIELEPRYDLPFVYRGAYHLEHGNLELALNDLTTARTLNPTNALAHLYLAQTQLALGQDAEALDSAIKANELDATLLPAYLALGQAYEANGQVDKAMGALQTYTLYQPDHVEAMTVLGAAYNDKGEYNAAVDILSRVILLDRNHVEANYQRAVAYFNLGSADQAIHDFKVAFGYDPKHFGAAVGLARAYDLDGYSGNAYVQMEAALGLADTNEERAICYYYEALFLEEIEDMESAAAKWGMLLRLPADAMPEEWRITAMEHLGVTATPTQYFSPTAVMTLTTQTPRP